MENDDVIQASRGNVAAFQRIVRETFERSKRIASRIVAQQADTLDVVQEAYTRAFVALRENRFRGSDAQLQSWLDRIVVRCALDAIRVHKQQHYSVDSNQDPDAIAVENHEDPVRRENLKQALLAVQELVPDQRAAFVLRELEGLSIRETALVLECSEGLLNNEFYAHGLRFAGDFTHE